MPTDAPDRDAIRRATDPRTSAAELATLALTPQLRPLVAIHPNTYPALLDWLGGLGEPAVDAVLAARAADGANPLAASAVAAVEPAAAVPRPTTHDEAAAVAAATVSQPPAGRPARRRRRAAAITAGAIVLTVAVGAVAAVGVPALLDGGSADGSAVALPAGATHWLEVAIDPSPGQKLEALALLRDLPGALGDLEAETGTALDLEDDSDVRAQVWKLLTANGADGGLDYAEDVQPWIGGRIGLALVPHGEELAGLGTPPTTPFLAIEATDTDAGLAAVRRYIDDAGQSTYAAATVRGDYIVVTDARVDVERAYAAGDLADDSMFTDAAPAFGTRGLASFWTAPGRMLSASSAQLREDVQYTTAADRWAEHWEANLADAVATTNGREAACSVVSGFESATEYYLNTSVGYDEAFEDWNACEFAVAPEDWPSSYGISFDEANAGADAFAQARVAATGAWFTAVETAADDIGDVAIAGTVRISDGTLELTAESIGGLLEAPLPASGTASRLSSLPEGTAAAISLREGGSIVEAALADPDLLATVHTVMRGASSPLDEYRWSLEPGDYSSGAWWDPLDPLAVEEQTRVVFEDQLGISYPTGVQDLLGDEIVITGPGDCGENTYCLLGPLAASAVVSTGAVDATVRALATYFSDEVGLDEGADEVRFSLDGIAQPREPVDGTGALEDAPGFAEALPDLPGSVMSAFIDVPELTRAVAARGTESDAQFLAVLEGFAAGGATLSPSGTSDVSIRIRLATAGE